MGNTVASTIIDSKGVDTTVNFDGTEEPNSILSGFAITSSDPALEEAYWKYDETEGSIAYDSTPYERDGTLKPNYPSNCPTWDEDGKVGGALDFDGTDDYVSMDFILNPAEGSFSSFLWMKGVGTWDVLLTQRDGGGGTGRIWLGINSYGKLMTYIQNSGGGPLHASSGIINDNYWHHVGVVWDWDEQSQLGKRYLYVDNKIVAQDNSGISALESSTGGMYVSRHKNGGSHHNGLIDDVRIYRRALSGAEISAIITATPAAYWKLDESEGTTAADSSGNGFDGTLNGDPEWQPTGGMVKGALSFDGSGDYVRSSYEDGPDGYTVALWYNLNEDIDTSTFDGFRSLVSKTGDEAEQVDLWSIWFATTEGLLLQNEKTGSNYAKLAYKPAMFKKDEWHHVVATATSSEGKIYFDGQLKNSTSDDFVNGAWDDSVPFDIARPYNGTADRFFKGEIDDVQVFDRVLNATEIRQLYRGGVTDGGIEGNGANATIEKCIIRDNYSSTHGGGIRNLDGTISLCTIK